MPKAAIWFGKVLWPWFNWSFSSAAIIFCRPARFAPPASARNSRQRLNHIAIIVANRPNTISSANTMM